MPVEEQQKTLNAKHRGHYQYYRRPTNYQSLWRFFREVRHIWRKWLPRILHSCNGAGSHT